MKFTREQFARLEAYLPVPRGNVKMNHFDFLKALFYIIENGCKWRQLPKEYGKWNSVYKRASRWANDGVLDRLFVALQKEQLIAVKIEILAMDSTSIKVHPDAHGLLKNGENNRSVSPEVDGTPNFTWLPRMTKQLLNSTSRAGSATTRPKGENRSTD